MNMVKNQGIAYSSEKSNHQSLDAVRLKMQKIKFPTSNAIPKTSRVIN